MCYWFHAKYQVHSLDHSYASPDFLEDVSIVNLYSMYYVEGYQSILVYGETRLDLIGILSYTDLGTSCYLLSNGVFIKKILSNGAILKFCDIDKPYPSSLSFYFLIRSIIQLVVSPA